MTKLHHYLVVALLFTAVACSPGDQASDLPIASVRDSSGVTIVENANLDDVGLLAWTVGEAPVQDIGVLDGEPEYLLFQVQSARRLEDGRILVANSGTGEIRAYDAAGVYLGSWGALGEGPGEFLHTTTMALWPAGDSLAVWDMRQSRLTLLAGDGSFGRTMRFSAVGDVDRPRAVWVLPDGRLVLMGIDFPDLSATVGLTRVPEVFAVVNPDGSLVAPIGSFPGLETFIEASAESVNIRRTALARGNVAEQFGAGMVIASNERFQLNFFGADGALTRIVRVDSPPRAVTEALVAAEVEVRASNMAEEARAGYRQSMMDMPMPETLPVFERVLRDPFGNAWVKLFVPPSEPGASPWAVFDASGQLLGRMWTPDGLEIHQIGEDFVLGVMEDEFEVEHVQVWPLAR
jgi:hypothetical protein